MTPATKAPTDLPPVAIAVLNFNGQQHLEACLGSLRQTRYPNFRVYLVDNNSKDDSLRFVRENFPEVEIIAFGDNLGFAGAYNRAVVNLDEEYIVLLNNDTEVAPDWLNELVRPMLANPRIAACGSKLLMFDDRRRLAYAGGKLTYLGGGLDIGLASRDKTKSPGMLATGYACGAAMLVRKFCYTAVGGFDADYFAYFEDVDLCWRMWLAGFEVVFVPGSVVYHKCGASWGDIRSPARTYFGERNRLLNMLKNLSAGSLVKWLPVSLAYSAVQSILLLTRGHFCSTFSIVRANVAVACRLGAIMAKRRKVQGRRATTDGALHQRRVIAGLGEGLAEFRRLRLSNRDGAAREAKLICLIGIDGSGKSAHAEHMLRSLRQRGLRARHIRCGAHIRFATLPLYLLCKLMGYTIRYQTSRKRIHTPLFPELQHSRFLAGLWAGAVLFDMLVLYLLRVKIPRLLGNRVIADRYMPDVIVEMMVATGELDFHHHWVGKILLNLGRKGVVLMLDREEAEAFKEKADIPNLAYLKARRQLYHRLAADLRLPVVVVDRPFTEVQADIEDLIRVWESER